MVKICLQCSCRRKEFDLGSGRYLGERNGNPLQPYCLENLMNRGARRATVHGVAKECDTTEQLSVCACACAHTHIHTHTQCIAQCSPKILYTALKGNISNYIYFRLV